MFLHGVKLLVYIFTFPPVEGKVAFLSESANPTLADGTTQTHVRFHVLLLSKSAQLFSLLLLSFFIPASSVREIIQSTGKMTDMWPFEANELNYIGVWGVRN